MPCTLIFNFDMTGAFCFYFDSALLVFNLIEGAFDLFDSDLLIFNLINLIFDKLLKETFHVA